MPPETIQTPLPARLLWWGPPGSGKTEQLVRELTGHLGDPLADPTRALLVMPNSSAVELVRRRLFHDPSLAAFSDRPLVAINQLPERLGVRVRERQVGDLRAQLLILAALGEVRRDRIEGPLTQVENRDGLVRVLRDQIRECKEWGYRPDQQLLPGTEALQLPEFPWYDLKRGFDKDPRILDQFREVWTRYERLKREGNWLDLADELLLACAAVESGDITPLDWLGIDGFDDLYPLQWRLLHGLIVRTPTVRFTLPTDGFGKQFLNPHDPRGWIMLTALREGILVDRPLEQFRRSEAGPLQSLHAALPAVIHPESAAEQPSLELDATDALQFWQPRDRRREVERTLRDIRKRVQAGEASFRDHLIVVRNREAYQVHFERTATSLGVPCHCFQGEPVGSHPLGQRWMAVAALLASDEWSSDAILGQLASAIGHRGDKSDDQDNASAYGRLALYLSQQAPLTSAADWIALATPGTAAYERARLAGAWLGHRGDLARTESPLPALIQALAAEHQTYRAIPDGPEALQARMDRLVEALGRWVIDPWRRHAWRWAAAMPVRDHAQVIRSLLDAGNILRGIAAASDADTLPDAVALLEMALGSTPTPDPEGRRDVVHVMSVMEARTMEAKYVYVLGLLASEFPRRSRPSLIIDERARELLNEQQRRRGSERGAEQWERQDWRMEAHGVAYEAWLFQVACTRASAGLVLSAPQVEGAQELIPSHWFDALLQLTPSREVESRDHLSQLLPRLEEWVVPQDAADWLACYATGTGDGFARGGARQAPAQLGLRGVSGTASWLATQLQSMDFGAEVMRLAQRVPVVPELLAGEFTQRLNGRLASTTNLNHLAQCGFKFFARYGCNLETPPAAHEVGMARRDQGSILHKALEIWSDHKRDPALTADQLLDLAFEDPRFKEQFADLPRIGGFQRRGMLLTLGRYLQYEREAPPPWQVTGWQAELRFGGQSQEPVTIEIPGRDAPLAFRGSIDRLDEVTYEGQTWSVIYDYKDSKKGLKRREDELKGNDGFSDDDYLPVTLLQADLQLPLYCLIAEQLTGNPTLAAFLYPLRDPVASRAGFLMNGEEWDVRAVERELTAPSPEQRQALYDQLKARIVDLLNDLDRGRIVPEPLVARACGPGRCDYAEICRYDAYPPRESW